MASGQDDNSVPYRQIRAKYDETTITVYQAYSSAIAVPAVSDQKLNASPAFRMARMTWIKPSWCWMMYRSGYSFKDAGQESILAIKMPHNGIAALLSYAVLSEHVGKEGVEKKGTVRVQWDPERNARLEKLDFRSIQIGIPAELCEKWIGDWTVEIENVTEKARGLKTTLEEEPNISEAELRRRGLLPEERPYELSEELTQTLKIARLPGWAGHGEQNQN